MASQEACAAETDEIVKPLVDVREYEYVKLQNELTVLLIRDEKADKCAAAMTVECGHFQNPKDYLGLAHFLEHMLFMGTEDFPDENSFGEFVTAMNGSTNAYTMDEVTTYYYDVNKTALEESLARFSSFFKCPLLKPDCVAREKKAVHSEHQKNLTSDGWKIRQLLKSTCNPSHPYSLFSTGNAETLGSPTVREDVKKLFDEHYSANRMFLVILGVEELPVLREMAERFFSPVKNLETNRSAAKAAILALGSPYHAPTQLGKLYQVVPVRDSRTLMLRFPIPMRYADYKTLQFRLMGQLAGHEGPGSLYAQLKDQGYVTSLTAGRFASFDGWTFWGCDIAMTPEGEEHWEDILVSFFDFIGVIRRSEDSDRRRIFTETKDLTQIAFDFVDKAQPRVYCPAVAANLRKYPKIDVLGGGDLLYEYDGAIFDETLECINTKNMIMIHVSKKFEGSSDSALVEKWYQTPYLIDDLSEALTSRCDAPQVRPEFFLPPENSFIPKDLAVKELSAAETEGKYPTKIYESPMVNCYFKRDNIFGRPKTSVILKFDFLAPLASVKNCFMSTLLGLLIKDAMNEITYLAELAYFKIKLNGGKYGFDLRIEGFSDTINNVLQIVLGHLFSLDIKQDRFDVLKEDVIRRYRNFRVGMPIMSSLYLFSYCLNVTREFFFEDYITVGENLQMADLEIFNRSLSAVHMDMLVIGNNSQEEIMHIAEDIEKKMLVEQRHFRPILPSEMIQKRIVKLKDTPRTVLPPYFAEVTKAEDAKAADAPAAEKTPGEPAGSVAENTVGESEEAAPVVIADAPALLPSFIGTRAVLRMKTWNEPDPNACFVKAVELGLRNLKNDILLDLLQQLITSPFFDQLRSQEQLGYMVGTRIFRFGNVQFLQFYIQGDENPAPFLHKRVDAFVHHFGKILAGSDPELISANLKQLQISYLNKFQKLDEEMSRYWSEIELDQNRFSRKMDCWQFIEQTRDEFTKEKIVAFYMKHFIVEQNSFTIECFPKKDWENLDGDKMNGYSYFEDVEFLLQRCECFPHFAKF